MGIRIVLEIAAGGMILFLFLALKKKSLPSPKLQIKKELALKSNQKIAENFEIHTLLASTMLMDFWQAMSNQMPTAVLSVIKARSDSLIVKKISRAVNLLSGFSHPNIVAFFGEGKGVCTGEWQQYERYSPEIYYTICEYVPGLNLKQRIAQGISISGALYTSIDILYALEFFSYLGLVHRNIKPSNILFSQRGLAKLTGFHLLKKIENSKTNEQPITREGLSLGTPEYMPIEQCRDASRVDTRSDLYSLGVILYEMLTGVSPFLGANLSETFYKIQNEQVPFASSVRQSIPKELSVIVEKAIQRDIEKRYQTPTEFRYALESIL